MSNITSTSTSSNEPAPDQTIIVGIGASAGGVKALTDFFSQVKPDSGMAYVVILHLSPDHDSQLAQILQQVAQIPVDQVTESVKIEANHAYVVPPNRHLQMEDGSIIVVPNTHIDERRAPVDIFFRTLAETHGPRAIAVILSGTGANGSMGLKRIKENGGGVFVQTPRDASYSDMPRHAIATDLVDEVLPVDQIPARLLAYQKSLGTITIPTESPQRSEDQQQALREVFTQLRLRTGHDFSNYKRPTLLRRLARRIHVRNLSDLPAYVVYLHEHPEEVQALLKDLLISVTNFFRDSKVFTGLEQEVIPALLDGKNAGDTLRIWVAGCATGEEAYSLAMLLAERTFGVLDAPNVQIFATDIDEAAITTAREGLYTLNDAADVSPDRLRRFFTKEGDEYRVRRELREMILFAHHNVLKDPPFSRLDMVSCRNLLIYLNQTAQERILETFHFALKPGSYLMLGQSETVDGSNDLYTTLSRDHHIYRSRHVGARSYPVPESLPILPPERKSSLEAVAETPNRPPLRLSYAELHQQLLEQYAPPSIIVNEEYDILHLSDQAGRYLHMAGGEPTKNLLKLIRPELRLELRTAFIQANQRQTNVDVRNLTIRIDNNPETITIHVRPVFRENDPAQNFILVLFDPQNNESSESDEVITSVEPVARHLEEELIRVKTQLRASNEHHELQAEELKAANEELQAMNEELRSVAEELETSKEELQSINEELITVNQELKVKLEEISITSNNFQNLINSTDMATLFLDRSLRVNLFTPATRQLFNLIPADYGRQLTDITNQLDDQGLFTDAERVLETLQPIEREVQTIGGHTFIMRVLPYRTSDDRINGIVITFVNITDRKAAAEAQRLSEEQFRLFVTASSDTIYKMSADWRQMLHLKGGDFLSDTDDPNTSWLEQYIPLEDQPSVEKVIQKAIRNRQIFELEHRVKQADGAIGWTFSRAVPVLDEQGRILEWFGAASDITPRKLAEAALRASEERQAFLLKMSDALRSLSDPVAIQETVAQFAMNHFGADRCYYCQIENDMVLIQRDASQPGFPSVAGTYSLRSFPLLKSVVDTGRPVVVSDVHTTEFVDQSLRSLCIQLRVISFMNIPIIKNSQPVGVLCITQSIPKDWVDADVDLAQEIAERTWAAVERASAERARRQIEDRQILLLRLNDTLRSIGNPLEIQQIAMQILGEHLGLSRAYYFHVLRDNDGWVHLIESAYQRDPNQPSMIGRHSLKPFGNWLFEDFDRGESVAVSDVGALPALSPEELALYQALGVTAFINVPLFRNGQYSAGIAGHDTRPHSWTSDEIALIRDVAARMWTFVERAQAEEALRISEERLSGIFTQATAGIVQTDADGTFTLVNQKYGEMLGYDAAEIVGRKMQSFTHPDDLDRNMDEFNLLGETGKSFDIEKRYIRKDGAIIWMHNSVSALRNTEGNIIQLLAVSVDITDRKRVEMALAVSEEKYRTLFESIDEGVTTLELIFDENERAVDFRYLEHNVALTRQTGLTSAIIGKRVSDIFPDLEVYWLETYERVVKTGVSERHDYYFATLDSWFDIFVSRVEGPASQTVVCVYNNITERKRTEERQTFLLQLNDALHPLTNPVEIQDTAARILGEKLDADRTYYALVEGDYESAVVERDYVRGDVPSVVGRYTFADFSSAFAAYSAGQILVLDDVEDGQSVPDTDLPAFRALSIRSLISTPLVKEGRTLASMSVLKASPHHWTPLEITLVKETGERTWAAVERSKAETALRESEQRLANIRPLTLLGQTEELANIGSWEYDRQTGQFNWSEGMYKLFRIESGQPVQPDIYLEFALSEDRAKARRLVTYSRQGEGQLEIDLRIWVGEQIKTLRIKADVIGEGDQKRVLGVDLDISDQLAAQQQIQETAENLQAVLDGSPAAIALLKTIRDPEDADQIIDFELAVGNLKLAQFFNKPLKKLLGQSAERFSRLLWNGETLAILRQVRQTGEARYDEQRLTDEGHWLAIATTRQDDGVLITALDISDLKTIQDQQQHWINDLEASRQSVEMLSELRESLRHRTELLRAVSHDLRGNFGIINSALHLLNMAASEADRTQMMDMVLRNVKQATGLLTELLDFSRLEAGQEQRSLESFDVTPLLQELSHSLQPLADEQGLRLESYGPETLPVEGDRLHVYRMAQNLIINAIKYTHTGSITVNWGIETAQERWWFSVRDTGPGIDPEFVRQLNTKRLGRSVQSDDPSRSDSSAETVSDRPESRPSVDMSDVQTSGAGWTSLRGEGIGLRIVRQLGQLLDARLEVSSEVGVGTQFVVYLPLRYA